jgi:hypothetical protein
MLIFGWYSPILKKITNYKSQITNKGAHEIHEKHENENNKKFLRGVQGGGFFKKSPPWSPKAKIRTIQGA